jgi:hypothetical protein
MANTYIGTVKSCACAAVYPSPSMTVGTVAVNLVLSQQENKKMGLEAEGEFVPINAHRICPEDYHTRPDPPFFESSLYVMEPYSVCIGHSAVARSGFQGKSVDNELFLRFGEKSSFLGRIWKDKPYHE